MEEIRFIPDADEFSDDLACRKHVDGEHYCTGMLDEKFEVFDACLNCPALFENYF